MSLKGVNFTTFKLTLQIIESLFRRFQQRAAKDADALILGCQPHVHHAANDAGLLLSG